MHKQMDKRRWMDDYYRILLGVVGARQAWPTTGGAAGDEADQAAANRPRPHPHP